MKIALITTTIYVPEVLQLYRKIGPDVFFIVTGDRKTPHEKTRDLLNKVGNAVYYSDSDQEKLGYKSSEVIGWNKIMRRNIALLEAIKYGAELIISIDDDNIPLNPNYFNEFEILFSSDFSGLMVNTEQGWFNVGEFLAPPVYHRGFPYEYRGKNLGVRMSACSGIKIGIACGMWLGDPDIDAVERLANKPMVYRFSDVLHSGLVLDRNCKSPFNSQNTAYRFELAPLMMVLVGVGRYDDIWSSYMTERILRETDYRIHYGKPFVWQERNLHNQWTNLKDEIFGMEHTSRFCSDLNNLELGHGSILEMIHHLYEQLRNVTYLPPVFFELGKAWCEDLEKLGKH